MIEKDEFYILIIRFLSGDATTEEKEKVSAWLLESDENRKLYQDFVEIWGCSALGKEETDFDTEKALEKLQIYKGRKSIRNGKQIIFHWFKYAAILVLVLSFPLFWWFNSHQESKEEETITIMCEYGDKTMMYLPDSSRIWLNSGSKIIYNNDFNSNSRELYLEGEAYFSVKKDLEHPFLVHTQKGLKVEVLGTEFNLNAYPEEASASVTLVNGSLQVNTQNKFLILSPNQKVVYSTESEQMNLEELSDLAPEVEWKNGKLIFKNESLEELEKKLERWFDVQIEFSDDLVKTRRFSGSLGRESINEVISYFGSSQYVDYKIEGNNIIFLSEN